MLHESALYWNVQTWVQTNRQSAKQKHTWRKVEELFSLLFEPLINVWLERFDMCADACCVIMSTCKEWVRHPLSSVQRKAGGCFISLPLKRVTAEWFPTVDSWGKERPVCIPKASATGLPHLRSFSYWFLSVYGHHRPDQQRHRGLELTLLTAVLWLNPITMKAIEEMGP